MKKFILKMIIMLALMVLVAGNLFSMAVQQRPHLETKIDLSYVRGRESADVREIESEIKALNAESEKKKADEKLKKERRDSKEALLKQIKSGETSFKKIFSSTLFVGDSLLAGLEEYNILEPVNTLTLVGASLYHLEDNLDKIILNNPENLVLHYGMNMFVPGQTDESGLERFIGRYTRLLSELTAGLPDTEIYVSGILNVDTDIAADYPEIPLYNEAMKEMCSALGVHFIDNSRLLPGDGHYYGGDGIHLDISFYKEEWLPNFCFEMKL